MNKDDQRHAAEQFRNLHRTPPILLLPNAWDPMSARIFEAAGFPAVATTSGGLAWALGYQDGEQAPWAEVVAATRRIVDAVKAPVTADIETGYGETPDEVGRNVAEIIRAGAVGVNLEDGTKRPDQPLRAVDDAAARIRAARAAADAQGVPIVINARIDLYLKHVGDEQSRFAETIRRAEAYVAAGADCIFLFGIADLDLIGKLAAAIKAPVNVVGRAGMPGLAKLQAAGVARVSIASGASMVVMSLISSIAEELRQKGEFDSLKSTMTRIEAQKLFARE
ncbi:MAG TPA: isocitrate lyase/phosphoenolpyruvate mutase family protein [Xanthobacteraceae bacterium]|nr:isocitrate lyase/phosphoenolpyruvate mutase family protein [Xanthobacteraceae bacterium]HUC51827.1 isocitrate lyase/phosphoenolpyruvate mutase family protein [Xanthobacteraceae bacterium]